MEALTTEEQAIAKEFADITVVDPGTETAPIAEAKADPAGELAEKPKEEQPAKAEDSDSPPATSKDSKPSAASPDNETPVENENSDTYKKRWASLNGMIVSEKERGKAAQKRIAELEAQLKGKETSQQPVTKEEPLPGAEDNSIEALIDKAREAYEDALVDGEPRDVTGKLYKALRDLENQRAGASPDIEGAVEKVLSARESQKETAAAVSRATKDYPFLDVNGDAPNYRAIAAVKAARDEYIEQGYSPADAIAMAVEEEAPRYSSNPTPSIPKIERQVDENKLREMAVIRQKTSPIITNQRAKAEPQSLEEAWKELN